MRIYIYIYICIYLYICICILILTSDFYHVIYYVSFETRPIISDLKKRKKT